MPTRRNYLTRFGAQVRLLRTERGWSQEELALRAGLDRSYVGGIERGERNVSLLGFVDLARALDVEVAGILPPVETAFNQTDGRARRTRRAREEGPRS
jgi:transcriptional regulator with XRE-family HTH domain